MGYQPFYFRVLRIPLCHMKSFITLYDRYLILVECECLALDIHEPWPLRAFNSPKRGLFEPSIGRNMASCSLQLDGMWPLQALFLLSLTRWHVLLWCSFKINLEVWVVPSLSASLSSIVLPLVRALSYLCYLLHPALLNYHLAFYLSNSRCFDPSEV